MSTQQEILTRNASINEFLSNQRPGANCKIADKEYFNDWNHLVAAYNRCLQYMIETNLSSDLYYEDSFVIAKTSIEMCFTPNMSGMLDIIRAHMMVADFCSWCNKNKDKIKPRDYSKDPPTQNALLQKLILKNKQST